ncbi:RusA family crossover junction endodeoxyribonuclease [Sorangium sp. So ce448]|uniref:RusA family crossover junction endodeoxyribonuclease n=1 Tax=Sorangium sp. So ce448 TaxID=3133314 RepID=UPI003F6172C3
MVKEIVVFGTPVTLQSKNAQRRESWKSKVAQAARDVVLEDELVVGAEVSAVIIYFYFDDTDIDLDNIAKPILDALPSIVYGDDSQIAQLLLRRTDLRGREVQDPSPRLLGALAQAIDELRDFVYIRVTDEAVAHERLP